MIRKALMTCALAGALTTGVAFAKVHVYVGFGPPAPIVETQPPMPGPGYVWTPGYYNYVNGNYVWTHGTWVVPPHGHHRWVAAHWGHDRHGWYREDGHWR